ncbi:Ff.00g118870.m01.CDS01 [Fusarium sp. VM40]|nr:Ff.00g118870.m01.CDS01 [Fusarium sp. VM40]
MAISSQRSLRFNAFVSRKMDHCPTVMRWDGAARSCSEWDNIRRDPELWFRNGNCMVHLQGKGQSKRGPSFKVPFSALLDAQCYPLIQRFLVWDGIQTPNLRELTRWSRKNPTRKIDLYIPPPPTSDKTQAFNYHLATRNFFAWVFRRSMVGCSLGSAIIGLLHSLHEFRSGVNDNVADMMDYFDEEGYLDMANQPNHALAMLHLAEFFQMRELYIRAFAHCVGMSEYLLDSPGFEELGTTTRKLLRKCHIELDCRMTRSSAMLRTFLDDELSEAHLSVAAGARSHLERFRSFLLSFYATKLGYYPPNASNRHNDLFDPAVLRIMREDFEALYDLLVDDRYTSFNTMPPTAHGGICTIQLVQSFDLEHNYETLQHPLPLIPETGGSRSRRMTWLSERVTLRSDRRVTAHAALINASNIAKPGVAQNDLVRAYRRFEEDSIMSPNKADKQDKVSLVDARKVRWILIYATYQVLRYATDLAPELEEEEINDAHYSLSTLTEKLPPWDTPRELNHVLKRQTQFVASGMDWSVYAKDDTTLREDSFGRIEIKPDIDYFALTHQNRPKTQQDNHKRERRASMLAQPSRSNSFSQALSRSSTIRRSMAMFKSPSSTPPQSITPPSRPPYHEIVVLGYGNGTNDVSLETDSSDSKTDDPGVASPESIETIDDSLESPPDTPPLVEYYVEPAVPEDVKALRERRRNVVSMMARSMSGRVSKRGGRPISAMFSDSSETRRHSMFPQPLRVKTDMNEPYIMNDDADWAAMQTFMESPGEMSETDDDTMPAWEQYADLGGLTDMR